MRARVFGLTLGVFFLVALSGQAAAGPPAAIPYTLECRGAFPGDPFWVSCYGPVAFPSPGSWFLRIILKEVDLKSEFVVGPRFYVTWTLCSEPVYGHICIGGDEGNIVMEGGGRAISLGGVEPDPGVTLSYKAHGLVGFGAADTPFADLVGRPYQDSGVLQWDPIFPERNYILKGELRISL